MEAAVCSKYLEYEICISRKCTDTSYFSTSLIIKYLIKRMCCSEYGNKQLMLRFWYLLMYEYLNFFSLFIVVFSFQILQAYKSAFVSWNFNCSNQLHLYVWLIFINNKMIYFIFSLRLSNSKINMNYILHSVYIFALRKSLVKLFRKGIFQNSLKILNLEKD